MSAAVCLQIEWRGEIVQLSWSPRAYHLKGLLSDEECEHIKKIVSQKQNFRRYIEEYRYTQLTGSSSSLAHTLCVCCDSCKAQTPLWPEGLLVLLPLRLNSSDAL